MTPQDQQSVNECLNVFRIHEDIRHLAVLGDLTGDRDCGVVLYSGQLEDVPQTDRLSKNSASYLETIQRAQRTHRDHMEQECLKNHGY